MNPTIAGSIPSIDKLIDDSVVTDSPLSSRQALVLVTAQLRKVAMAEWFVHPIVVTDKYNLVDVIDFNGMAFSRELRKQVSRDYC